MLESEHNAVDTPPFHLSLSEVMMKSKFEVIDSPPEGKKKTKAETKEKKEKRKKKKKKRETESDQVANEAAAAKAGGARGSRQSHQVISTTEEM